MGTASTFVIAEAGVNHNGDLGRALEMIRVAADAGADAVKFQTFTAENLVTSSAPKAVYQKRNVGGGDTQFEMLRALELPRASYSQLTKACTKAGIEFMSTPFDIDNARFLAALPEVKRLKVASGEITNAPLLLEMARSGKPVVLSTGMSSLDDIKAALGVIAFGYTKPSAEPSSDNFNKALMSDEGKGALQTKVSILHCTSEYPAPPDSINLRAMKVLSDAFGLPVGLSDHSQGISVPTAAVALGAVIIEKHFTLDRSLPGPDHEASLTPSELKEMVSAIRTVEQAMGSPEKSPVSAEIDTQTIARKSLVALKPISPGEKFSAENLGAKRPGGGISPLAYWSYLGRRASRGYAADELIEPS